MKRLRVHLIARALRREVERTHGDGALAELRRQRESVAEVGTLIPIARIQRIAIRSERRRQLVRRLFGLHRATASDSVPN